MSSPCQKSARILLFAALVLLAVVLVAVFVTPAPLVLCDPVTQSDC